MNTLKGIITCAHVQDVIMYFTVQLFNSCVLFSILFLMAVHSDHRYGNSIYFVVVFFSSLAIYYTVKHKKKRCARCAAEQECNLGISKRIESKNSDW